MFMKLSKSSTDVLKSKIGDFNNSSSNGKNPFLSAEDFL